MCPINPNGGSGPYTYSISGFVNPFGIAVNANRSYEYVLILYLNVLSIQMEHWVIVQIQAAVVLGLMGRTIL